jgi:hypothetical protein
MRIVVVVCTEAVAVEAPYWVETKEKANHTVAKTQHWVKDVTEAGATALSDCGVT